MVTRRGTSRLGVFGSVAALLPGSHRVALAILSCAVSATMDAWAQVPPLVAVVSPQSETAAGANVAALRRGMADRGIVEGTGFRLVTRYADGDARELAKMLDEIVSLRPRVIVVASSAGAVAARQATRAIPVVFAGVTVDPVALGLVESPARPGGNLTGLTHADDLGLIGKRLELLREAVPELRRLAVVLGTGDVTDSHIARVLPAAAASLGIEIAFVAAQERGGLASAIGRAADLGEALFVSTAPLLMSNRDDVVAQVARTRRPAIYGFGEFARAGGLLSYGPSLPDTYRQAAGYVERILRGESPANLPVQQATRFELVINLGAARDLGLVVPPTLIARADEVIE